MSTPSGAEIPSHALRQLLERKGLSDGRLERTWTGPGSLSKCEFCDHTIRTHDTEFELHFRQGVLLVTLILHRECWQILRGE